MPKTLAEKILSFHSGKDVKAGDYVVANVDVVMAHDTTCAWAIEPFEKIADRVWDKSRVIIPFDHMFPAPNVKAATLQAKIRRFAQKYGLSITTEGVCHQILAEKIIEPGMLVLGADSHTPTGGALGALAIGVGSTDAAVAMATGKCWFRVPETIKVEINGEVPFGVFAKDVVLKVASILGPSGAVWKVVEYTGEVVRRFKITERLTLTNMTAEMGATSALIEPDENTFEYLKEMGRPVKKAQILKSDRGAKYERIIKIDVSNLSPLAACPHDIDNVEKVEDLEKKRIKVDKVFIGSCTNCRIEDLDIVYKIFKKHRPASSVMVVITPASKRVYLQALAKGYVQFFTEFGIAITPPGCGACLGRGGGVLAKGEVCVSTGNRNFKGRMGSPEAFIYLASPATAAASAVAGYIKDPGEFLV